MKNIHKDVLKAKVHFHKSNIQKFTYWIMNTAKLLIDTGILLCLMHTFCV